MALYQYQTLRLTEIRILQLASGSDSTELSGTLLTISINSTIENDFQNAGFNMVQDFPHIPYKALSYYWGPDDATSKIWLAHSKSTGSGTSLSIKPNLEKALKKLRRDIKDGETMNIWTDYICIDQGNIPERNAQIQKMADIYSQAEEVHIWLGEEYENSDLAMTFAKEVKDPRQFEQALNKGKSRTTDVLAFSRLMHRDWFSRRWVVQEISLASTAIVHCGNQSIRWDDLEEAISIFSTMGSGIRQKFRNSEVHGNPVDLLGEVKGLGATYLVEMASNMTQRTPTFDRSVMEHRMSLEGLMSTMAMFETSNPYDIVYALLWLAHDVRPNAALSDVNITRTPLVTTPISESATNSPVGSFSNLNSLQPPVRAHKRRRSASEVLRSEGAKQTPPAAALLVNYSSTLFECYRNFLKHVFHRSKSLDIICRAWALEPTKKAPDGAPSTWVEEPPLPSWIQILTHNRIFDFNFRDGTYERVRANPLVGKPGTRPSPYSASGKRKHEGPYVDAWDHDRTLTVRGFTLGDIKLTKDAAYEGNIPTDWLKTVGWTSQPRSKAQKNPIHRAQERPDWVWRFLVAERGVDGYGPPPMRFRAACTWLLDNRTPGKAFQTSRHLIDNCPELVGEYIDRVTTVVWQRRLVIISYGDNKPKLFGLAPAETEIGDLVCIVYGCSVPIILRKVDTGSPTPPDSTQRPPLPPPTISVEDMEPISKRPRVNTDTNSFAPSGGVTQPKTLYDRSSERYEFVGECYVYGMMAGEGFKHREDNDIRSRFFTLV